MSLKASFLQSLVDHSHDVLDTLRENSQPRTLLRKDFESVDSFQAAANKVALGGYVKKYIMPGEVVDDFGRSWDKVERIEAWPQLRPMEIFISRLQEYLRRV